MAHASCATLAWTRGAAAFHDGRYGRGHEGIFDRLWVPASAVSQPGPLPLSRADALDPEEDPVAPVASSHMRSVLHFARRAGFGVDSYRDAAGSQSAPNAAGKLYVTRITPRPDVCFSGARRPDAGDIDHLHHRALKECHVAHSPRADVIIAPVDPSGSGNAHQDLHS